jgi:serine/threonine-protein kinase
MAPREAAKVMACVAGAVASAHAEGLLHRDIKPGNVLLAADGTPKVTDFGLAKFAGAGDALTLTGAVLGTPSYMAPEQAAGRTADVGERTDVYGIGATFYELLTGRPPHKGLDHADTIRRVLTEEVKPPRAVRPEVPAELEAVCLKCLEKEPPRRYSSAKALADDLDRWLAGKPTEARPRTSWDSAKRWVGRHRVATAAVVLLALLAVGGAIAYRESDPERQLRRALAEGKPVTLVGEKGLPRYRYYRWELGEVKLALSEDADGAPGFQSHTQSLLELTPDAPSERYRFSAEIKHVSGRGEDSRVGVYFGPSHALAPGGELTSRWYGFQFTELPPADMSRPGLTGYDHLTVRAKGEAWTYSTTLGPVFPFPSAMDLPGPWRRIVVDVSPGSVFVSWRTPEGTLVAADPQPARSLGGADLRLRGQFSPPEDTRGLPVPDWVPRGPVGVYVINAGIAFRNVVIEPPPNPPTH